MVHDQDVAMMQHDEDAPISGPARVGMELRQVRERLGWRLSDVSAELRIRLPYLEAIERGELSALPGAAYQTGFVRTYAQALGLDGDEILRRFRAEGTGFVAKAELSFLAPVPDRAVPTGAIVLVCVLLVLTGYGLWYRHTEAQSRLAANVPPVPTELAPLAVPPKLPEIAAPTPAKTAMPAAPAPVATPQTATAVPQAAVTQPPASPAQVIQATGDDWVEVKDAKGSILYSHTMHAGDSWPVPNLPGLTMTAGNAGATTLATAGKTGAPLGTAGTVLRAYALTPALTPTLTPASVTTAPPAKAN